MAVEAVVFDIGETLVDETRYWGAWADWLGVPRLTLFGVLGGLIERCEDHRRVFDLVVPEDERERVQAQAGAVWADAFERAVDFYPDVVPCIDSLRERGYRIGLAANQPEPVMFALERSGVRADFAGSSSAWGVAKPDAAFFERVAEAAGLEPERIAYVGDRLDNDVLPAKQAGMVACFVRRGPWGFLHALRPDVAAADIRLESLAELPAALARV